MLKKVTPFFSTLKAVHFISLCIALFFFSSKAVAQFDIPPVPKEQTSVYDYIKLLSSNEKTSLEQKLLQYSDSTSTQIVIAIIATTKGENIGLLAPQWAHKWGIGQAKEDNGVFILLAKDDRNIWISPGYGVEHKLTAGITGELIRNIIIPEFKKGNYYSGLDKGADAIFNVLKGTYTSQAKPEKAFPLSAFIILFVFFAILIIALSKSIKGGKGGGSGGKKFAADSLLEAIILSNMGRGSFKRSSGGSFGGWKSSGGGGFSGGFGGGGFSGGGAGGSW